MFVCISSFCFGLTRLKRDFSLSFLKLWSPFLTISISLHLTFQRTQSIWTDLSIIATAQNESIVAADKGYREHSECHLMFKAKCTSTISGRRLQWENPRRDYFSSLLSCASDLSFIILASSATFYEIPVRVWVRKMFMCPVWQTGSNLGRILAKVFSTA